MSILWKNDKLNIALLALILLLAAMGTMASEMLRFDREAIAAGEIWRLVTAHFVHLGWVHAGLNLLGLILITLIFQPTLSLKCDALALGLCIAGISSGLWFFSPELHWYVGFSGVLHGYFIYYLLKDWQSSPLTSFLGVAAVVVKVLWEQSPWGDTTITEDLIGGEVAIDAHLFGTLSGLLAGLVLLSVGKLKTEPSKRQSPP